AERRAARQGDTSVFAMIQTLSRANVLTQFGQHQFDYVVIDEFHHSEASTYRAVLDHFTPRFLLGLTATPERMDGRDVLRWCDYNVAYEARLFDAIEQGWLVPFQYFAVYDESDYSDLRWTGMGYDEEDLEQRLSTDTRAEIIVRNLNRFLPATGKIKALAFCVNRGHAQYMSAQFTRRGVEALCLLGDSAETERAAAMRRLQDEDDSLQVICSVDILGEGVDIPTVSHVLLLRPTMSFTVFLQQLGRGLRHAPSKDFLVALDFVGNWRNSYVVPLVFRGCNSLDDARKQGEGSQFRLPAGCIVDADTQVQRIWDDELRQAIAPRNRHQLLQETYRRMRDDLGRAPTLLDFHANPDACDPQAFVRHYGNWLRAKDDAGDLTKYETQLLGTTGESFLQHVEKELNPARSYKMVVLLILLQGDPKTTEWHLDRIAHGFRQHYLDHLDQLADCSPLAQASNPEAVPMAKIRSRLKSMPLNYLSNTEADYFTFHRTNAIFAVKPHVHGYWRDVRFRELLRERVVYALTRYFHRKGVDVSSCALTIEAGASAQDEARAARSAVPTTLLPFFPTLRVAAGHFREGNADYDQGNIDVPDPRGRFRSDRLFVVQVQGDSMNGGSAPIQDGDFIVLEPIDASRAGSLTAERAIAVEYRDEVGNTSYSLKEVRKTAADVYWLHSWNREYQDIPVDAETMFPFARLIENIGVLL
ncbi:MAG: DEAD/DEAH box helicase family protein, partial [Patescibacteria group bacterium]|nr:DEAD/DEAH box helicase family protein [Patescibacteria group bacterium]